MDQLTYKKRETHLNEIRFRMNMLNIGEGALLYKLPRTGNHPILNCDEEDCSFHFAVSEVLRYGNVFRRSPFVTGSYEKWMYSYITSYLYENEGRNVMRFTKDEMIRLSKLSKCVVPTMWCGKTPYMYEVLMSALGTVSLYTDTKVRLCKIEKGAKYIYIGNDGSMTRFMDNYDMIHSMSDDELLRSVLVFNAMGSVNRHVVFYQLLNYLGLHMVHSETSIIEYFNLSYDREEKLLKNNYPDARGRYIDRYKDGYVTLCMAGKEKDFKIINSKNEQEQK